MSRASSGREADNIEESGKPFLPQPSKDDDNIEVFERPSKDDDKVEVFEQPSKDDDETEDKPRPDNLDKVHILLPCRRRSRG